MARIQLPSVRQQVQQPVGFDAPRVAPLQDAAPQQLQALGQAQQAFGVSGSRISADLQDEYDAAILNKADLAADGVLNEEFGGYLSLQGEQATGTAKKDATAAATKRIRAIQESGLKTAAQRTLFEQQMTSRMQEWTQRADRHERDQVRNFSFGMHTAKAQSEGMDAAATVGTPMFLAHKDQMLAHVDSAADLQGLGADQKKLLRLGATTTLHKTIIDNMVVGGHATAAKDYLDGAQGEIEPRVRTQLSKLVDHANVQDQSVRLGMKVMDDIRSEFVRSSLGDDRAPTVADTDEAWRKAYETVDQQFRDGKISVEMRAATRSFLKEQEGQRRADQAAVITDTQQQAEQWLIDHPDAAVEGLPPDIYENVRRLGLEGDMNTFSGSTGRYPTDPTVWTEINLMTPAELRAMPADRVASYRSKLSPQQWKVFVAARSSAAGKATDDMRQVITIEERMRRAARQLGILPTDPRDATKAEMRAYDEWSFQMNEQLQVRQSLLGKKADDSTIQEFLDERVTASKEEVSVANTGTLGWLAYGTSNPWTAGLRLLVPEREMVTLQQAQATGRAGSIGIQVGDRQVTLASIPPSVRTEIEAGLIDAGVPVTVRAIIEEWVANGSPAN